MKHLHSFLHFFYIFKVPIKALLHLSHIGKLCSLLLLKRDEKNHHRVLLGGGLYKNIKHTEKINNMLNQCVCCAARNIQVFCSCNIKLSLCWRTKREGPTQELRGCGTHTYAIFAFLAFCKWAMWLLYAACKNKSCELCR